MVLLYIHLTCNYLLENFCIKILVLVQFWKTINTKQSFPFVKMHVCLSRYSREKSH